MKKNLLNVIAFLCFATFVMSCSSDKEERPSNEISSTNGLKISLEWTTGSSSTQAKEDADLDLYLMKGQEEVRSSETFNFENIAFENVFADGEYKIVVDAYSVSKKADYTLYVTDGDGEQVKTYNSFFNAGDTNLKADLLKIVKSGNKYTFTTL